MSDPESRRPDDAPPPASATGQPESAPPPEPRQPEDTPAATAGTETIPLIPGAAVPPELQAGYLPGNYAPEIAPAAEPRPRGVRRLLLLLTAALGAFIACAALSLVLLVLFTPTLRSRLAFLNPATAAPPEAPNKYVDPPSGPVTITDDFSNPANRWDRSQTSISGGAYELTLELADFDSYGLYLGGSTITDFDMAVDATMTAGPPDAEYGIRFRQSAPDEHLIFSISPSGYYRLARVSDKTYTSLVPWTRDSRIRTGVGETNRLRVVATGPEIVGYINGEQVLTFSDDEQNAGQLTLGLVTFEQGGLTVRFDTIEGFAIAMPDGVTPQRLELNETFEDPTTAQWSVGGATIRGGAYEFFVGGPVLSWQQPLPTGSSEVAGDFAIEVEATMVAGDIEGSAGSTGYGLMFGDDSKFNFFALMILPQGGIMLYRNGPDGGFVIPPVPVDAVNPGLDAANKIRVEVRGRTLTLTINDQPVTVNGEPIPALEFPEEVQFNGMAGLILQGMDTDGVRARFDNFKLEEIE